MTNPLADGAHRLFGARVTLRELIPILRKLYSVDNRKEFTIMLHGDPGIGKTSVADLIAMEAHDSFMWFSLPTTDYNQICGFPDKDPKTGKLHRLPILEVPSEGKGIYLIDDLTHAPGQVQNIILDLATKRRLLESYLGDGWMLMICANTSGNTHPMSPAVANRMLHFYVVSEYRNTFRPWAIDHDLRSELLGFLDGNEACLCIPPEHQEKAYPTPRSLHKLSVTYDAYFGPEGAEGSKSVSSQDSVARILAEANVGAATATKFMAYLEVSRLIDIEKVVRGGHESLVDIAGRDQTKLQVLQYATSSMGRSWWNRNKRKRDVHKGLANIILLLDEVFRGVLLQDLIRTDSARVMGAYEDMLKGPAAMEVRKAYSEISALLKKD